MPTSATPKFSGIFVSYRRDDSSGHAGRLADRLVEHFGRNRIFVDIDTIEPGEDFVTVIENAVGSCEILIAVIGQNWLSAGGGTGRLDNPNDFVRLEIATALRRDIRVIPVLVQRANMPKLQDLPEDLVKLARRNAIELSDLRWQSDVDQLIDVMERVLAKRAKADQLAGTNQSDEEPKRRVDKQLLAAEKAKLDDRRRNVEAEPEAQNFGADVEGDARAEQEVETPEEPYVAEPPVHESHPPRRQKRLDGPSTLVSAGPASPPDKHRNLMLIGGASLLVLLAATIVIWLSQTNNNSPSNPNPNPAPTQQPSVVTQSTPAPSTPTPQSKPSPPLISVAFAGPTLWRREDTGSIYKIVRDGNTLRGYMDNPATEAEAAGRKRGDLAFEGSYADGTLRGTAHLLYSAADVSRCPSFAGDQPFGLSLTLSEDGNTLSGSREDFKLSEDCQKVKLPRKKLTYTRASVSRS